MLTKSFYLIMKFRTYLEQITGVGIFPLISLLIFFVFFTALVWWVVKANKKHIENMSHLPLGENE